MHLTSVMKRQGVRVISSLEGLSDWQFFFALYAFRWILLGGIVLVVNAVLPAASAGDGPSFHSIYAAIIPALVVVLVAPVVETLVECLLPHMLFGRIWPHARLGAVFPLVSALLMVAVHPIDVTSLWGLYPLVTGTFIACVFKRFSLRSTSSAFWAAAFFHSLINLAAAAVLLHVARFG